ncbi:hypothetical protein BKA66DRAFT_450291 [Pyrenochaeta sp. MPI-SDFR-AT-0127]|nr:hypothetical protein BKA66DRAFT_450291 [Pyrenochaeta sp. MPI-SDFR-AT-0127]
MDTSPEDAIPAVKSTVTIDPNAPLVSYSAALTHPGSDGAQQNARFSRGNLVHMSQILNGQRIKGVFTIDALQYNSRGDYVEYQLRDALTEQLHRNGAWIREKDLKLDRRG